MPNLKRNIQITIRLNKEEREKIQQLMRLDGEASLSSFFRRKALKGPHTRNDQLCQILKKLDSIEEKLEKKKNLTEKSLNH